MHPQNPTHLRTIHPTALAQLGEEACIVALGVARDLRSGVIPPEKYDQTSECGSSCCLAGHIAARLAGGEPGDVSLYWEQRDFFYEHGVRGNNNLFAGGHPSDPLLAADAIERFVYDGSQTPWVAK